MKWRLKATIQNLVDKLPPALSYPIYYHIQRHFGGFKDFTPIKQLCNSVLILKDIKRAKCNFAGKTFLEIGTGHTVNIPIGLWLAGASRVISVDLNPYLKEKLVAESLQYICQNRNEIRQLFSDVTSEADVDEKLNFLCEKKDKPASLFESMNFQYLAPVNARHSKCAHSPFRYRPKLPILPIGNSEASPLVHFEILQNPSTFPQTLQLTQDIKHLGEPMIDVEVVTTKTREFHMCGHLVAVRP